MKYSSVRIGIIFFFCLIGLVSCFNDAERNNPLDPKSDNFKKVGAVSGQTFTFYAPFTPLQNVEIRLQPGPFVSKTNAQGQFLINDVPEGRYQITASKEGYALVSDSVDVQVGQTTHADFNLDGLPNVISQSIISCHISRWWPQNDLFLLEIVAQVEDPDGAGDVELVQIQIPELNFLDTLEITQTLGTFMKKIPESKLPGKNLQDVLGREIFLTTLDRAGSQTTSKPNFLARIIELTPETESPQGLVTLQVPTPTLIWKPVTLPFQFSFNVEVVRVDQGINNTVWTLSNIGNATNSVTVADSLVSGTYFWTISVVDEFGNCSRSKEASFLIN